MPIEIKINSFEDKDITFKKSFISYLADELGGIVAQSNSQEFVKCSLVIQDGDFTDTVNITAQCIQESLKNVTSDADIDVIFTNPNYDDKFNENIEALNNQNPNAIKVVIDTNNTGYKSFKMLLIDQRSESTKKILSQSNMYYVWVMKSLDIKRLILDTIKYKSLIPSPQTVSATETPVSLANTDPQHLIRRGSSVIRRSTLFATEAINPEQPRLPNPPDEQRKVERDFKI